MMITISENQGVTFWQHIAQPLKDAGALPKTAFSHVHTLLMQESLFQRKLAKQTDTQEGQ